MTYAVSSSCNSENSLFSFGDFTKINTTTPLCHCGNPEQIILFTASFFSSLFSSFNETIYSYHSQKKQNTYCIFKRNLPNHMFMQKHDVTVLWSVETFLQNAPVCKLTKSIILKDDGQENISQHALQQSWCTYTDNQPPKHCCHWQPVQQFSLSSSSLSLLCLFYNSNLLNV